jgi:hypothetical protein
MSYRDGRTLEQKLHEHRRWNTNEVKFESASIDISRKLLGAISALRPSFDWKRFVEAFDQAIERQDEFILEGLIRLTIFCANETPNRFKGIFPAYLVQCNKASLKGNSIEWNAAPSCRGKTIDISRLVAVFLSSRKHSKLPGMGAKFSAPVLDFKEWAKDNNSEGALKDFVDVSKPQKYLLQCLSSRLAQGADTNRRGHGATDLIKERLAEWGFIVELGNVNKSDVPVSNIAPEYTGPRKYDTVIKNASGEVCLISQSQMYSSDVGSIQGKTVEEDATPNKAIKDRFPNCCIVTHTEGFGCHTSMISRLKHVLSSDLDGFIQIKTLDTKLRNILRLSNCPSLLDFESILFDYNGSTGYEELISNVQKCFVFSDKEIRASLKLYLDTGLLLREDGKVFISPSRRLFSFFYKIIDIIAQSPSKAHERISSVYILGGFENEITFSDLDVKEIAVKYKDYFSASSSDDISDEFIAFALDRGFVKKD